MWKEEKAAVLTGYIKPKNKGVEKGVAIRIGSDGTTIMSDKSTMIPFKILRDKFTLRREDGEIKSGSFKQTITVSVRFSTATNARVVTRNPLSAALAQHDSFHL